MLGPVGSPYPGKYVMFIIAAFSAVLAWRASRSAIRASQVQRTNAELGTTERPEPKKSVGTNVVVATLAFMILVAAMAAIWMGWPQ